MRSHRTARFSERQRVNAGIVAIEIKNGDASVGHRAPAKLINP
jgi:hypothetical protein